ncbi:MAG: TMEM165/GDT1 family protein, partial [Chloroflexi bacterium]
MKRACASTSPACAARSNPIRASRSISRPSEASATASTPRSTIRPARSRWRWRAEHADLLVRRCSLRPLLPHPPALGHNSAHGPAPGALGDQPVSRWSQSVINVLGLGVTVFTVIFLLELPDKTALAALLLATRHRPLPVFLGTAAAFLVQSAVAVAAGSLLSLLPREPIRIGAGILFLIMAAILIRQNLKKTEVEEERQVEKQEQRH